MCKVLKGGKVISLFTSDILKARYFQVLTGRVSSPIMKAVLALLLVCLIKLSLGVRCLQQQNESIKVVTQIMKGHDIWYNTFMWPGKNVTLESIAMDSNNVTFLYWLDNISSWFYYFKSVGIVKCVSLRLIKFEIEIEFVVMTSWSSCSNASLHCQEISPILLFGNTTNTFLFSRWRRKIVPMILSAWEIFFCQGICSSVRNVYLLS